MTTGDEGLTSGFDGSADSGGLADRGEWLVSGFDGSADSGGLADGVGADWQITLVLNNIRSAYNVGAILRTAEGFGVTEVVLAGYTPWFKRPGILPHLAAKLERQIARTAVGAEKMVPTRFSEDILGFLESKKAAGAILAGLENNISDTRVVRLSEARRALGGILEGHGGDSGVSRTEVGVEGGVLATEVDAKKSTDCEVVLILGEEVKGISTEILEKMDVLFEIPMMGRKESFNVSVAAGVALYELRR